MKKLFALLCLCSISLTLCPAQVTKLELNRSGGLARVNIIAETNRDYTLSAGDLSGSNWDFLATLTLTNSNQAWYDSAAAGLAASIHDRDPVTASDWLNTIQNEKLREQITLRLSKKNAVPR